MERKYIPEKLAVIVFLYSLLVVSYVTGKEVEHELFSAALDESRSISVVLPESYNEKLGVSYPVLYVLDGAQQLPHTAGTARSLYTYGEMPDLIVVAVHNVNRTRDMTPKALPGVEDSGKADIFFKFLNTELKPYIQQHYRANGYNMLAGHSFGGLFAAYSLILDPNAFQARFAFSPSLRFLGPELFEQLQTAVARKHDSKLYFYMNVGGEQERVLKAFREVEAILHKSSSQLVWHAVELPQETHFTTPIIGQFQAFRELFNGWKLSLAVSTKGVPAIQEFYRSLSDRVGYDVPPEEAQINNAANEVLQVTGNTDLARQIFEMNLNIYPESPNSYAGLARISQIKGDLASAAQLMEKAISLTSEHDNRYKAFKDQLSNIQQLSKNSN